jgi:hypothetical protein
VSGSPVRIHTTNTARAGEWRDIFGTDVLPIREIVRGTAPGIAGEATFYILDDTAFPDHVIKRAAEWTSHRWGRDVEAIVNEIRGEHGLPLLDRGDIRLGVDARVLA